MLLYGFAETFRSRHLIITQPNSYNTVRACSQFVSELHSTFLHSPTYSPLFLSFLFFSVILPLFSLCTDRIRPDHQWIQRKTVHDRRRRRSFVLLAAPVNRFALKQAWPSDLSRYVFQPANSLKGRTQQERRASLVHNFLSPTRIFSRGVIMLPPC